MVAIGAQYSFTHQHRWLAQRDRSVATRRPDGATTGRSDDEVFRVSRVETHDSSKEDRRMSGELEVVQLECELFPERVVSAVRFVEVTNAASIRKEAMSGSLGQLAVLDGSLVIGPTQLAIATMRALLADASNSLITHTVHSEIIYGLSPSSSVRSSPVHHLSPSPPPPPPHTHTRAILTPTP